MNKRAITNFDFSFYGTNRKRFFFNFFKSRKKITVRPGALEPEQLKEKIGSIGKGKKVNIQRVEYDGTPDEQPVTVKIIDIQEEYFTGKFVNIERSIKQDLDDKLVYVKGGGGTIDFYFDEGDIKSVVEDIDEVVIEEMNEQDLLAILDALDLDESILISYYDMSRGGVMNGTGKLVAKDIEQKVFTVELSLINDIELDDPKSVSLDLSKDKVLDLEVVI